MVKQQLRKLYKQKRLSLTAAQIDKCEDLMLIQFQQLPLPIPNHLLTYAALPAQNEYDPTLVEAYCYFKNEHLNLYYPKINRETNQLNCVLLTDETTFEENQWGILEPCKETIENPKKIEMVLIPLLSFDTLGNRVGYGKGYYDKFLSSCSSNIIKIGFSFFEPVSVIDDANNLDVALNYCITPNQIYSF